MVCTSVLLAQVSGPEGTGAAVTGAAVTGAAVTGAAVTGAAVTGAAVVGAVVVTTQQMLWSDAVGLPTSQLAPVHDLHPIKVGHRPEPRASVQAPIGAGGIILPASAAVRISNRIGIGRDGGSIPVAARGKCIQREHSRPAPPR